MERKHRHVIETSLTLLAQANLPLKFWNNACLTATYLIDGMPTPLLAIQSPFYLLYHFHLDYKFLKDFGCACYPYLRPYSSHKFNFHSHECLFLGYSSNHKGYKCLAPNGRLYISKDVIFNESKFPYPQLFQVCSSSPSQLNNISSFISPFSLIISSSPLPVSTSSSQVHTPLSTSNTTNSSSSRHLTSFSSSLSSIHSPSHYFSDSAQSLHESHIPIAPSSADSSTSSSTSLIM